MTFSGINLAGQLAVQSVGALTAQKVVFSFGNTPYISFDCSISETHKRESNPTEFTIENGQTISDHIIVKPFGLKIQGLISNTPLTFTDGVISTLASSVVPNPSLLKTAAGAVAAVPLLPTLRNPAQTSFARLLVLQGLKLPFQVTTSLLTYNNMWIKSLSVPRESKSGSSVIVDLELVQLLLVNSAVSDLGKPVDPEVAAKKVEESEKSPINKALEEAKKAYQTGFSKLAP